MQVHNIPEHKASVFPMVKHPFIVGFLVAELPTMHVECLTDPAENEKVDVPGPPLADGLFNLPSYSDKKAWGMQAVDKYLEDKCSLLTVDQKNSATKIALSLAMAYVMDQVVEIFLFPWFVLHWSFDVHGFVLLIVNVIQPEFILYLPFLYHQDLNI